MKKTDYILIGVVVLLVIIGVISSKGTIKEAEIEFPLKLSGEVGLNEITYQEYENMVNNGDAFVVVIERTGCSWCQQYMPIMEEVANEKKIAVTYINTDNLTDDEFNDLQNTNKYLKKNQWGTPTTIFMLGNRIVDAIGGYVDKDSIVSFFTDRVIFGE